MPGRVSLSVQTINMTRNQNQSQTQRNNVARDPAGTTSKKREEKAMRDAFRKEHKIESYLADDENFPVFSIQLKKMGLQLRDIPGDGNCLFRALGDQLEGHSRNHYKHRLDIVRYMLEHRMDFEPFIEDDVPFQSHIQNLKKLGTYAGNDAIVAFARLHSVNIVIHQLDAKHLMIQGSPNPKVRQLHIAYHNGDHYSSVRKVSDNTESPANIRLQDEVKGGEDCHTKTAAHMNGYAHHLAVVRAVRGCEDIEEEVMTATHCKDANKVREVLLDCDYDVDLAIAHMLQVMDITDGVASDDTVSLASQRTSTDSGVWSDSTVGRSCGKKVHFREDSYGGSSGYGSMTSDRGGARPKLPQHQFSARKTKERKMEKKKRAEDRHRMKVLGYQPVRMPSDDEGSVVTVISRVSSITRI